MARRRPRAFGFGLGLVLFGTAAIYLLSGHRLDIQGVLVWVGTVSLITIGRLLTHGWWASGLFASGMVLAQVTFDLSEMLAQDHSNLSVFLPVILCLEGAAAVCFLAALIVTGRSLAARLRRDASRG